MGDGRDVEGAVGIGREGAQIVLQHRIGLVGKIDSSVENAPIVDVARDDDRDTHEGFIHVDIGFYFAGFNAFFEILAATIEHYFLIGIAFKEVEHRVGHG